MKITRRKLPATLWASSAVAALGQAPPPAAPEDDLKAARDQVKRTAETLAKTPLPMATEPAFQFKV